MTKTIAFQTPALDNNILFYLWTQYDHRRLITRNHNLFTKLYKQYKHKVYNYLLIKTYGNIDIANDILSDTFYSAWISITYLKNTDNILGWLFQIAKRRLCDYFRKLYREKKYYEYLEKNNDIACETYEVLYNKKLILMVNIAVDNLKPIYKRVIRLKYFEEKTLKQIGEMLGRTETSIANLILRARKCLRRELKDIKNLF